MTFGWSYPPGVTGGEYEIAGPDWEAVKDHWCPECLDYTPHEMEGYRHEWWGWCMRCENEIEGWGPDGYE